MEVAIRVAHADGLSAPAEASGDALGLQPRERRVPRDVNVSANVSFNLSLIVREQHVVER